MLTKSLTEDSRPLTADSRPLKANGRVLNLQKQKATKPPAFNRERPSWPAHVPIFYTPGIRFTLPLPVLQKTRSFLDLSIPGTFFHVCHSLSSAFLMSYRAPYGRHQTNGRFFRHSRVDGNLEEFTSPNLKLDPAFVLICHRFFPNMPYQRNLPDK